MARVVESSLREMDRGVIEAAEAMGCTPWQIVTKVLLPECRPSLISGCTTATITILSYGAMAGSIGAGGLGAMALLRGYGRGWDVALYVSVILLVILVQIIQSIGTSLAVKTDRRVHQPRAKRKEEENNKMKRKLTVLALALALLLSLAACGGGDGKTITVGATPAPHAEILEVAKEVLAEEGYTLEIKEYDDYIMPNTAVEEEELDANYFQHITYLNDFNESNGTHLVSVGSIHYEPFGIYAGKTASLDALADGAQIAIPNDATNGGRALLLLAQEGLITLEEGAGITATVDDIVENPHSFEIVELEARLLPTTLQDVDVAVINGNYAIDAGLNIADALAIESAEGEAATAYANVLVVKEGHENDEGIQALLAALESDEVKAFIDETYDGAVVPLF